MNRSAISVVLSLASPQSTETTVNPTIESAK